MVKNKKIPLSLNVYDFIIKCFYFQVFKYGGYSTHYLDKIEDVTHSSNKRSDLIYISNSGYNFRIVYFRVYDAFYLN